MKEEKKIVRICFNLDEELHKFIKSNAALRGISMTNWITVMLRREAMALKTYSK
jgi:predicted HicB family RNase H-like nuclease